MKKINRRDFLKYSSLGMAVIVVGCGGGGGGGEGVTPPPDGGGPGPVTDTLNFTITDAMKEMVTYEPNSPLPSDATCYFWSFKEARFPADCPGPQIYAFEGDVITVNITNNLDGPHAFFIPGRRPQDPPLVDTGSIAPGETVSVTFEAKDPGSYLYYDNLNAPVNRVMGLHGAFIVIPDRAESEGTALTPYGNLIGGGHPVQQLFNDFGRAEWWPGLRWAEGDAATGTPPARQYVWLCHQASPVLFAEVGQWAMDNPGEDFDAADFVQAFTSDPFVNVSNDLRTTTNAAFPEKTETFNRKPNFFTVNGQSGFFGHHNPVIIPFHRIGEPTVVHILNAGLMSHSMHMHANHFFVTAINNEPQDNPLWLDVHQLEAMMHLDYVIPYMRPPDIPNTRGIGRQDPGLPVVGGAGTTWPPQQEFGLHFPPLGTLATNFAGTGTVDLAVSQSPLCYPMHDHSEPTQTAQGGNYNCGLIAGMYIIGDRGVQMDFPQEPGFTHILEMFGNQSGLTGPPVGAWPPEDPSKE